jgi:hypothetical protein
MGSERRSAPRRLLRGLATFGAVFSFALATAFSFAAEDGLVGAGVCLAAG